MDHERDEQPRTPDGHGDTPPRAADTGRSEHVDDGDRRHDDHLEADHPDRDPLQAVIEAVFEGHELDAEVDPAVVARLEEISTGLQTVEPSERMDAHLAAALASWDQRESVVLQVTPGAAVADTSPSGTPTSLVDRRQQDRHRRWRPTAAAWLGAAAAVTLVVAGATVMLARDSDDSDASGTVIEMSDAAGDGTSTESFPNEATEDAMAPDAMTQSDVPPAIAGEADRDVVSDGAVGDAPALAAPPDRATVWLGEIDVERLGVTVAELLGEEGSATGASDIPCSRSAEVVLADGLLDDRPVLIGLTGSTAVAVDTRTCEILAEQRVPDPVDP